MIDEVITLEMAKLIKEKGFDWKPEYYWFPNPNVPDYKHLEYLKECGEEYKQYLLVSKRFYLAENFLEEMYPQFTNTFPAPTLSQVQRWLRDVYGINVLIKEGYGWEWYMSKTSLGDGTYNSYEEALIDGLTEALKLL